MPALPPARFTAFLAAVLAVGLMPWGSAASGSQSRIVARPSPIQASGPALESQRPVAPTVRSIPVSGVAPEGLAALAPAAAQRARTTYEALSRPVPSDGFAVTGVTWSGRVSEGVSFALRTRTDGAWSAWTELEYDAEHGPSPTSAEAAAARPGTDPFVVGDVDDIQLRATSPDGKAPAELTLSVIDPGVSQGKAPTSQASAATVPVQTASPTPQPTIYSRSAWGADERLRDCCVEYGEVHAGYVHHTVNSNDYTRAEVPAILRGIYAYHTQSRGWRDIGYNFLVDKFGRIWEGRYGGIALPVVGAHTLDYNENSFAGSAIGNFETARPSAAMLDAYARLFAWKLSLHGVRPGSRQNVAGTTFDAISGHRDAAQTACPGKYLYQRIAAITVKASMYQHGFGGRDMHRSFLLDSRPDVLLVRPKNGAVSTARGTGGPGFAAAKAAIAGFSGRDQITAVFDVTGDKRGDLTTRSATTGQTVIHPGRQDGTFGAPVHPTTQWAGTDLFAGPGDVTGDGLADVVARRTTNADLLVYAGRGDGTFRAGRVARTALAGVDALTAGGDFNRDGDADLIARGSRGVLWLLPGDGTGLFPVSQHLSAGWKAHDVIMGGLDLSGDGRPDVAARDSRTGNVRIFANIGGGALSPAISTTATPGRPWTLSRDLSGDRRPDLVSLTKTGGLVVQPARRQNWLAPIRHRGQSWTGAIRVMIVGDWDRDGYVDAMARERGTGTMALFRGLASGGFAARSRGWRGWQSRSLVTPVGDFDGDGRPDLMARASDGHIWLYPGRGIKRFGSPVIMRSSLPRGSSVVSVGLWNKDGAPDVLVRLVSGTMLLYPGNGPGGLDDPIRMGSGFERYDALIGGGDLTGDGQVDLLGRSDDGRVWLIPGRQSSAKRPGGTFTARSYVGSEWGGYIFG